MRARTIALGAALASSLAVPLLAEMRVHRPVVRLSNEWRHAPVEPRGSTALGISFRLPQLASLGLELKPPFEKLIRYPFQIIRLGAYWNRIEPQPGSFDTHELDWQIDVAERAGKKVILCVGPLKCFGYPEFFVPDHRLRRPIPERTLVTPSRNPSLLEAACEFATRIVERYASRPCVVAWQVEHEAVDPLGFEHSWRLAEDFVATEVAAVRRADPTRPILMNGFLPASLPVRLTQWFQTRDQGDSLAVAQRHADIVGIDYYPRHALASLGRASTLYLDGSQSPWQRGRRTELLRWARASNRRIMVSEGQAEPWEAVTTPPNPSGQAMFSCPPEQIIRTYNDWQRWSRDQECALDAYLFWGAEYWVLREQSGDPSYLATFRRILEAG